MNAAFDQHERLDKLLVVSEEWTPENGLLTPTLKLRRALIEERYAAVAPKLMERDGRMVWLQRSPNACNPQNSIADAKPPIWYEGAWGSREPSRPRSLSS